jgi:hypothetical protein
MSTNPKISIPNGNQCWCGDEIIGYNLVDLDTQKLREWFTIHCEPLLVAITNRTRDRLLLPRIDTRINNLAQQLKRLEQKYQFPHQRVSARDLVAFGIRYPLNYPVYDYQYRDPQYSPVRDLDCSPLADDNEFIQISHSYEPLLYNVRFYLGLEIDFAVWEYNRIDRRNYYREFRYDLLRLFHKGFPVRDHLHCIFKQIMQTRMN